MRVLRSPDGELEWNNLKQDAQDVLRAMFVCGLSSIETREQIIELCYRVWAREANGHMFRTFPDPETGEPLGIELPVPNIVACRGLSINSPTIPEEPFDLHVRRERLRLIESLVPSTEELETLDHMI